MVYRTESLQTNLDDVDIWYSENRLMLKRVNRCRFIGKKELNYKLNTSLGGHEINQVNDAKYLDINVDDQLNWYTHLKNLRVSLRF